MIKKYGLLVLMAILVLGLLFALIFKDSIYEIIGNGIQQNSTAAEKFEAKKYVEQEYNYTRNQKDFDFTLLEFKSTGCTICKQMEPVLAEIENWDKTKVNVQKIQIMNPNSQELMKFFAIAAVPTHILLDKSGKELYRKYGFIPENELKSTILSEK